MKSARPSHRYNPLVFPRSSILQSHRSYRNLDIPSNKQWNVGSSFGSRISDVLEGMGKWGERDIGHIFFREMVTS